MTTYNKISEQIQRLYVKSIDRENLLPLLDKREVRLLVNQIANAILATEAKQAKRIGDMSIPSCSIATYPQQAITIATPVYTLTSAVNTTFNLTAAGTVISSPIITYAAGSIIKVGDLVTHANLPAGTTVLNILSTTSATLTANATATGSALTLVCWNKTISFANNTALRVGDSIAGTGIPTGATVVQILSNLQANISVNATAATAGTYTVTPLHVNETTSYSAFLPVIPIKLPFDVGVWGVYVEPYMTPLIPVTSAMMDLVGGMDEGLLENQVGYVIEGRKIRFVGPYALLNQVFPSTAITISIKLLIVDVALLADDDPFPVPPEVEWTIVQEVVKLLLNTPKAPEKPNG